MTSLFRRIQALVRIYGPLGIFRAALERQKSWSLTPDQVKTLEKSGSSASDNSQYLGICALAVSDGQVFEKFRRNHEFRMILEHVSKKQGRSYIRQIDPKFIDSETIQVLEEQSRIGSPFTYKFRNFGKISPTSIRYLKVFTDLLELFGSLDEFTIGEIGVGFGGQASLISQLSSIKQYRLYDLPEVLELNKIFLGRMNIHQGVQFHDGRNPDSSELDLVISNYAFSELIRPVQKMYLDNVILKSRRGYITWNDIAFKNYGSYSLNELLEMIPGSYLIEEKPLTWPGNVIIVWGK